MVRRGALLFQTHHASYTAFQLDFQVFIASWLPSLPSIESLRLFGPLFLRLSTWDPSPVVNSNDMSDSKPWSDGPNAPQIPNWMYAWEKEKFAGLFLGAISHGAPTYLSIDLCSPSLFGLPF